MSALVHNLYNNETIGQWHNEKTMMHSSGIWGRQPVLKYLRERVLRRGNIVVDLGAGAGYPILQMKRAVLNDQHAGVLDFEADARRGAQPIQANP